MTSVVDEVANPAGAEEEQEVTTVTEKEEDQENAGNGEAGEATKKKKKRKKRAKKKKKIQLCNPELGGIWKLTDEEFNSMCQKWLEETKDQVEGIPKEVLESPPKEFATYSYTGVLRPCYVTKQMTVSNPKIPLPDYFETGDPVSERSKNESRIPVLNKEEQDIMRHVSAIGREVLDIASRFAKVGVTTDEIDRVVFKACMERDVYPSPLNYNQFPKSVCTSVNEAICHAIPDSRKLEDGDILNLDISVYGRLGDSEPYHTDLNEMFLIGKVDEDGIRLVRTAYECLKAAADLIRPGTLYREVGDHISKVARKNGCQVVRTYSGHGVGRLFHGLPNVPHYGKNKGKGIMAPGHVFTIEPMINLGTWRDTLWPDNWTAVTLDGKRSAQFEHAFLVTETGVELLTAKPGTDRTVMPPWDEKMFRR